MKMESFTVENQTKMLSLRKLVTGLVSGRLRHLVSERRCLIENDVNENIFIASDRHTLSGAIGTLLHSIIENGSDSSINISAKNYGNVVLLHVRTGNSIHRNNSTISELSSIQVIAGELGGCITHNDQRSSDIYTLSFIDAEIRA